MYLITSHHDGEYIPESITYVKNVDDKNVYLMILIIILL